MLSNVELLKIKLMSYGMKISDLARKVIEGDEKSPLTLADFASASGITMELENQIWVNAPIPDYNPNFASNSSMTLQYTGDHFFIEDMDRLFPARPIPVPKWHNQYSQSGKKLSSLAKPHADRIGIVPIDGCSLACKFCDVPFKYTYHKNSIEDLIEVLKIALEDPVAPAKHIIICGGTPKPEDFAYQNKIYATVAETFPHVPIDIMMVPRQGLLDPKWLKSIGITGVAANLEIYNQDIAHRIMPKKYEVGIKQYFAFIEEAVDAFGIGNVRSLMVAGLEPLEDTLKGVEELASRGCDPVLSPFRPDPATPLRDTQPPSIEYLVEVYEEAKKIVQKYPGVALGPRCIPCMHNSLVFPDNSGSYFYY